MQLSKRLQAAADLVTRGNKVADIGCDHAYTSIYLAKNNISSRILAMDVNQGPLDRAKENIIKYQCEAKIETRISNGLEKLKKNEVDTIIIAGMGGLLTLDILSRGLEIVKEIKELILQPQSEIVKVREFLTEHNFLIVKENMLFEEGKYYTLMKAMPASLISQPARYELESQIEFNYGRLLLEERNQVLKEFLIWDFNICEGILDNTKEGKTQRSITRRKEVKGRMDLIRKALDYYKEERD